MGIQCAWLDCRVTKVYSRRATKERAMAIKATRAALLVLAAVALSFLPALRAANVDCVYTIYVRTGSVWRGGTDSIIGALLYDSSYTGIYISNLELWGGNVQGNDRDYFQRGALDIFSGLGACLDYPICGLNLTSDGTGDGHGWYVNYVEVTFTGAHLPCNQHLFTVERWLSRDRYPYSLYSEIEECAETESRRRSSIQVSG